MLPTLVSAGVCPPTAIAGISVKASPQGVKVGGWGGQGVKVRGRGFLHRCITNIRQRNLSTNEGFTE